MPDQKPTRILLTGGGTGGHLFPAIALMEEIKSRFPENDPPEILFVGTRHGLEARVVPEFAVTFRKIWIRGFQRGRSLRAIFRNLLFPLRLLTSLIQSHRIIRRFHPDFAIGTGGYTSGPPLHVVNRRGIPFFIHEQNVVPGVTTKLLARKAHRVYISFDTTQKYIENAVYVGTPLRRSLKEIDEAQARRFFELRPNLKTILIFGGSQGSLAINEAWLATIRKFADNGSCQFIWQTGQIDFERIRKRFGNHPLIRVTPFIHQMGIAYSASNLVVSRAGALSVAELCTYGKPSVLIPLPSAAENHQELNARHLEKAGAAAVILQSELDCERLHSKVQEIIASDDTLRNMARAARQLAKPDASKIIVDDIFKTMEEYAAAG